MSCSSSVCVSLFTFTLLTDIAPFSSTETPFSTVVLFTNPRACAAAIGILILLSESTGREVPANFIISITFLLVDAPVSLKFS